MEYKYTDEARIPVVVGLTVGEIDTLRLVIEAVLALETLPVGRWSLRDLDKALAKAQDSVADTLAYQVNVLRKSAKPKEE